MHRRQRWDLKSFHHGRLLQRHSQLLPTANLTCPTWSMAPITGILLRVSGWDLSRVRCLTLPVRPLCRRSMLMMSGNDAEPDSAAHFTEAFIPPRVRPSCRLARLMRPFDPERPSPAPAELGPNRMILRGIGIRHPLFILLASTRMRVRVHAPQPTPLGGFACSAAPVLAFPDGSITALDGSGVGHGRSVRALSAPLAHVRPDPRRGLRAAGWILMTSSIRCWRSTTTARRRKARASNASSGAGVQRLI
jgi:hypothetical protein